MVQWIDTKCDLLPSDIHKGIDYDETFSPVAHFDTIRTILSIAASEKLQLAQFDVKTAFLYGELEKKVYMQKPEGYENGLDQVCKLKKSLYGLKQAPRCWNKKLRELIIRHGLKQSTADPCLLIKTSKDGKLLVVLYVDDGLIAGTDKKLISDFLEDWKGNFKITTGPLNCYLGIEI